MPITEKHDVWVPLAYNGRSSLPQAAKMIAFVCWIASRMVARECQIVACDASTAIRIGEECRCKKGLWPRRIAAQWLMAIGSRYRMEAISATTRIHHTSCRRGPDWTAAGYRSATQGLPPRYADRGSADESRERGCRGAHRRADAARLHARSKPDIRSPWCGGQIKPNAATNAGTKESQCRCR